jgi:hypothetical protein
MPSFVIERENPGGDTVREHARPGGFPANRLSQATSVSNPTTAE